MGIFGYAFPGNLSPAELAARRESLDTYGALAQVSALAVFFVILSCRVLSWLLAKCARDDEEQRPSSPYLKAEIENEKGTLRSIIRLVVTKTAWWMGDDAVGGLGKNGEVVLGAGWMIWLLVLCVKDTGSDYMHLTKRFGIVAASQLPLHYLLAMKSAYSPVQMLTRMSHEQLNSAHQVLGRIIQILLSLHAMFYLNFFIQIKVLAKRVKDRDVILGLVCISIITLTATTALASLRRWNYRVFYVVHVISATLFLPLAYFHVHHLRIYIWESAAVYLVHMILRVVSSTTQEGAISLIPKTSLIEVKIPPNKQASNFKPGQHVYLSLPQGHKDRVVPNASLSNPFTVASLPSKDKSIILIARAQKGNTKSLADMAKRRPSGMDVAHATQLPLKIEGPYGGAEYLPDLSRFDKILLVAGGVGATFIVPIWRHILDSQDRDSQSTVADLRVVWAVRSLAETSWAFPLVERRKTREFDSSEAEIYVTGGLGTAVIDGDQTVELAETTGEDATAKTLAAQGIAVKRGRPDLHDTVEEFCSGHIGRVAVLVCGPTGMYRALRREVGRQVWRGKNVYWHAESFGL